MNFLEVAHSKWEKLDADGLSQLVGQSMLLTSDFSDTQIEALARLAEAFESFDRAGVAVPLFPHQLNTALFFDNSTRTRSSWAGASARLGAHPFIVDGSATQVAHGETPEETGCMLGMNSHAMGIRHDLILGKGNTFMREAKKGIDDYLAAIGVKREVPMVNLQCDVDHPTQSMSDLLWLRERFGDLRGLTMTVSWAYSPSYAKPLSVPQGLITLLSRYGVHLRLAYPEGYGLIPSTMEIAKANSERTGGSFTVTHDMDEAVVDADIVYPKSWGPYDLMLERVTAAEQRDDAAMKRIEKAALERNRSFTDWIYDERRHALTEGGNAQYMHCLPADLGAEVARTVYDRFRVDVSREANKKVYVIMALLAGAKQPDLKAKLASFLR